MQSSEIGLADAATQDERGIGDGSLRRFAYEQIEDLLNSGRLKPGQLVSQRELVEATGATLGSIREAIPRFEAEGLLVTVPKKGLMVPSLDVTFVREAYQVRRMIELAAVPDLIRTMPDKMLEGFRQRLDALEAELLGHRGEVPRALLDRIQREDWLMHSTFVGLMGNSLMNNIYRVTAIKIRMAVQSRLRVTAGNAQRIMREHRAILDSLAARDSTATALALMRHIGNSLEVALGRGPDLGP